ncbi:hypothetical protein SLITO_v1c06410 [Spiroplasma litorale]|uniref:Uncharacterized protein n=1 Tax=Spiroplasma litorale TaxID=216942 RepID=A0A0K1W1T3_9MOLU|nr:hypothetical protein SLITO_v1c06410 [Spiroplasma litorale]
MVYLSVFKNSKDQVSSLEVYKNQLSSSKVVDFSGKIDLSRIDSVFRIKDNNILIHTNDWKVHVANITYYDGLVSLNSFEIPKPLDIKKVKHFDNSTYFFGELDSYIYKLSNNQLSTINLKYSIDDFNIVNDDLVYTSSNGNLVYQNLKNSNESKTILENIKYPSDNVKINYVIKNRQVYIMTIKNSKDSVWSIYKYDLNNNKLITSMSDLDIKYSVDVNYIDIDEKDNLIISTKEVSKKNGSSKYDYLQTNYQINFAKYNRDSNYLYFTYNKASSNYFVSSKSSVTTKYLNTNVTIATNVKKIKGYYYSVENNKINIFEAVSTYNRNNN